MKMSDQLNEIFESFSKFQAEVTNVKRDSQSIKYKYAKLEQVVEIIRDTFSKFDLSFSQMIGDCSMGYVEIENIIMHKSGQYFSTLMKFPTGNVPVSKEGRQMMSLAQYIGSIISYGRRYSLLALSGMAQEDDDAALPEGSRQFPDAVIRSNRSNLVSDSNKSEILRKLNEIIKENNISDAKIDAWKEYFAVPSLQELSQYQINSIISKIESSKISDSELVEKIGEMEC